ncbi:MAG: nitroreductase family protein [Candidatus Heimdallarchaeota archaeon]|nr:nitroreductase family protein [Candidatus Heimdallarchaeota archaeon]
MGKKSIRLPAPKTKGKISLEETLASRRTCRTLTAEKIALETIGQLLWALQGITLKNQRNEGTMVYQKAAPSPGRSYPLVVHLVMEEGYYQYVSSNHELQLQEEKDLRTALAKAPYTDLNKKAIATAPVTVILAIDNQKAMKITPLMENALRFSHLEAGHATQNLLLQATALKLGACTITSFQLEIVYETLHLPENQRPIYLIPIGCPKKN